MATEGHETDRPIYRRTFLEGGLALGLAASGIFIASKLYDWKEHAGSGPLPDQPPVVPSNGQIIFNGQSTQAGGPPLDHTPVPNQQGIDQQLIYENSTGRLDQECNNPRVRVLGLKPEGPTSEGWRVFYSPLEETDRRVKRVWDTAKVPNNSLILRSGEYIGIDHMGLFQTDKDLAKSTGFRLRFMPLDPKFNRACQLRLALKLGNSDLLLRTSQEQTLTGQLNPLERPVNTDYVAFQDPIHHRTYGLMIQPLGDAQSIMVALTVPRVTKTIYNRVI